VTNRRWSSNSIEPICAVHSGKKRSRKLRKMIEAARISSGVTGGSKLYRVPIFRHMLFLLLANRDECWSLYYFTHRKVVADQIGYKRR
jgi:hypothetical protein